MHLFEVEYNQFLSSWGSLKLVWREVGGSIMKKIETNWFQPTAKSRIHIVCGRIYHHAILMFIRSILDIRFNLILVIMFILLSCFCLHIFCISCDNTFKLSNFFYVSNVLFREINNITSFEFLPSSSLISYNYARRTLKEGIITQDAKLTPIK